MAKKKEMTPAERLAAALVPGEEQPYEIPANWQWVKLGSVVEVSKEKTENFSNLDTKYVGLENMQKGEGIISYGSVAEVKSTKNVFHAGQILYGKLRPYLNKHDVAEVDGVCSTDILVLTPGANTDAKFLNYFLDQPGFIAFASSHSKGINLPRVSAQAIVEAPVPLPPLAEQERIVAHVEELFAKLDEAEEKIRAALAAFDRRRAAMLRAAFTGRLTAAWRTAHGRSLDEWEKTELGKVATWGSGGTPSRKHPEYYGGTIPWLKTGELNDSEIYDSEEKITENALKNSSAKIYPEDTVVVAMYGATIGKTGILKIKATTNQACACAVCGEKIFYRFLFFYLLSQKSDFINSGKGGAQPNISQTVLKYWPISLPPLDEQREIVRVLDETFAREAQARAAAEAALAAVPKLRRAVLARAFRGELGTNDPAEPPALSAD